MQIQLFLLDSTHIAIKVQTLLIKTGSNFTTEHVLKMNEIWLLVFRSIVLNFLNIITSLESTYNLTVSHKYQTSRSCYRPVIIKFRPHSSFSLHRIMLNKEQTGLNILMSLMLLTFIKP
jgi:hypothetical protein